MGVIEEFSQIEAFCDNTIKFEQNTKTLRYDKYLDINRFRLVSGRLWILTSFKPRVNNVPGITGAYAHVYAINCGMACQV